MKVAIIVLTTTTACHSCIQRLMLKAYDGEDISDIATINTDKETKQTTIEINSNEKWAIYTGRSVEKIDMSHPLFQGNGIGNNKTQVIFQERMYYQLVTEKGRGIIAEKHLPMSGGYNFRDMGGIKTKDGRFTKWGKFFRSDDLHNLTDADLHYLSSIPLLSVVDFRSKMEMQQAPDKLPQSIQETYKLSIDPGSVISLMKLKDMALQQMDSIMMQMNIFFVSDNEFVGKYKQFFELLQNEEKIPLLFHCSAGKDRTGMAAALILYALGVDEETIMKDYLASNIYLGDKYAKELEINPDLKAVLTVKPEFLQAGIDRIKEDYGKVENFLEKALNVNIKKFREQYLY